MNVCFMCLIVCSAFGEINDDDDRDACVNSITTVKIVADSADSVDSADSTISSTLFLPLRVQCLKLHSVLVRKVLI